MKTYHFTTTITVYHSVEANNEDEAFDLIENIDPLNGELDYQEWELRKIEN